MVYTNVNSSFPSQVVPAAEKSTYDYGLAKHLSANAYHLYIFLYKYI